MLGFVRLMRFPFFQEITAPAASDIKVRLLSGGSSMIPGIGNPLKAVSMAWRHIARSDFTFAGISFRRLGLPLNLCKSDKRLNL